MPDFYNLYNQDGLEVGEDMPEGMYAMDEMMVDDYDDEDECMVVEEPEDEDLQLVPGSEAQFVEFNADDDSLEVRETSWEEDGDHSKFTAYLKDKMTKIPRHSGQTIPGCERALSYLKNCDQERSKAMRTDLDGKIDENEIEEIGRNLYNMMDRLENHIDRLKKAAGLQQVHFVTESELRDPNLEKTAGLPVINVYMTPFERAIVGTMINATVSGGKNIEEVYAQLKNKYNFTPREELALQQLVADHGYPVYKDRGLLNEPTDPASGDNMEWQTNYNA